MRKSVVIMAALVATGFIGGCDRKQAAPPAVAPEVAVISVKPERVVLTTELPGRTSGYMVSEIRPQVSGLIQKRLFEEGSEVKAGQVLYQIDPAPFQAAVESANSNVVAAQRGADRAAGVRRRPRRLHHHNRAVALYLPAPPTASQVVHRRSGCT